MQGAGVGTAPYRGTARVATSPEVALDSMAPGDVLVVRFTTPAYNTVLMIAGAVVTTEGALLSHAAVNALLGALRTSRDRAMVEAMVLGGLRRCEVLGLRLGDVNAGERRLFIAEGKGAHQRIVPISARFFATLGAYLEQERPDPSETDRVFVVLKGPNRGRPLTASGMDEIMSGARKRAGLDRATCHQLRHTCFTRLREAGMALEAIQAQAGHAFIESTRIYVHLANDWLEQEYLRAVEAIEAQSVGAS